MFLPVTMLLYFCCPFIKGKNIVLLFASLVFYAWGDPKFVLIMLFSIVMNYFICLPVGNVHFSLSKRKVFLAIGVSLNLLLLFIFKYLGFSEQIINSFAKIFGSSGLQLTIHQFVLPLGISFYTFQSLSYLIDVYRTPALVQKNVLNLGLYISFFPQLIAGPIVRYHDINEQIKERKHSVNLFASGIERFIIGLTKKVLIANTLAEVVDGIINLPYSNIPSIYMLLVILSGGLQIYYDFSGYSDMAIGLGRMFGFKIAENFNYPLLAVSPTEFWRRWHISLSTWFRDYLYIPLGGSRKGPLRQVINILIVFTLVGLWHGASYNFLVFGFSCGVVLVLQRPLVAVFGKLCPVKGKEINGIIAVLSFCYRIGASIVLFMFFKLDLQNSLSFYSNMFNITRKSTVPLDILILTDMRFYISFFTAILFSFPWWRKLQIPENSLTVLGKYILLLCLFIFSFGTLTSDAYNPFIYFRF
jgi:alginate O-acetyltransferase complex protein AlgI